MAAQAYEETVSVSLETAEPLDASAPEAYPYPLLRPSDQTERRTLRLWTLDNGLLKVSLAPDLGGRIFRIEDRRTGRALFGAQTLSLLPGPPRGAIMPHGLRLLLGTEERRNTLGPVEVQARDTEEGAEIWIAEFAGPISFHARFALPEGRAALEIEMRAFNRTLDPLPYQGGLRLTLPPGRVVDVSEGFGYESETGEIGWTLLGESDAFETFEMDRGELIARRFAQPTALWPRQTDVWRARLVPFSGLEGLTALSEHAAIGLREGGMHAQVSTPVRGKWVLRTPSAQTLEAPAELSADTVHEITFEGLPDPPAAIALLDARGETLLRWPAPAFSSPPRAPESPYPALSKDADERTLARAAAQAPLRAQAHLLLAMRRLAASRYAEADELLETSLLYQADDPLAWWLKAIARRLMGEDEEERPELLNAHYLAPLEPALRAESFLSQKERYGKEPSPLLAPLAEDPEAFREIAALLIEAGLIDQAIQWLDEALRHRDDPMLRYLLAFLYLAHTRMRAESAEQIAAAERLTLRPPYPWRAVEREALRALAEAFPTHAALRDAHSKTGYTES